MSGAVVARGWPGDLDPTVNLVRIELCVRVFGVHVMYYMYVSSVVCAYMLYACRDRGKADYYALGKAMIVFYRLIFLCLFDVVLVQGTDSQCIVHDYRTTLES